jgi:hypothetical protein
MGDFMKIYSANNNKTISVVDNSSGVREEQSIKLEKV